MNVRSVKIGGIQRIWEQEGCPGCPVAGDEAGARPLKNRQRKDLRAAYLSFWRFWPVG